MIGLPPSLAAVNATDNVALPVVICVMVGAVGTVNGVTGDDGAEDELVPTLFTAYTRK